MKRLMNELKRIDNKGYKAYKDIQGKYSYTKFDLFIDYVQGDPFATPSKIRIVIPAKQRPIKAEWLSSYERKIAAEDKMARVVASAIHKQKTFIKGSGKSGLILFDQPGQEVIERSAVQLDSQAITVCISVGLPANGRRINGKEAEKLLGEAIPTIIENSIFKIKDMEVEASVQLADQQVAIRETMKKMDGLHLLTMVLYYLEKVV